MKIQYQIIFNLICSLVVCNTAICSSSSLEEQEKICRIETSSFNKKGDDFWVIKNKQAFINSAQILIDNEGNWKGVSPPPQYVKYTQELSKDDLPLVERWLKLKDLTCFAVADLESQPNLSLITIWYLDLKDEGINFEEKHLDKLAWLDLRTTLNEINRGKASLLPSKVIETNRAYQMKNSHYSIEDH